MEFKEIDINAPIIHYVKHLKNEIEQKENQINSLNDQISSLNYQLEQQKEENIIIKDKLLRIKNNPVMKILLKIRRIYLNFLDKNK